MSTASASEVSPEREKLPRVDVVFNPVSGHGKTDVEREIITTELAKGYEDVRFHETTVEVSASTLAYSALRDGAKMLVASGGDGTVTAVAAAVRNHAHGTWIPSVDDPDRPGSQSSSRREGGAGIDAVSLGIIPRGTANAFCSAVGIPSDVEAAARLINDAETRPFDVAMVNNDEPMMLLAGIGLEAEVVLRADRGLKDKFGILAYFLAGVRSVASQKTFKASLTLHSVRQLQRVGSADAELVSEEITLHCPEVAVVTVANAAPPTSMLAHGVGPVSPEDGLLNVVCVSPRRRLTMISAIGAMLWSGLVGQRVKRGDVYGLRARRVEIKCEPAQRVVVDGEDCGYTPVVVELAADEDRRQIGVVAPKQGPLNRQKRRLGRAMGRGWRNLRGVVILGIVVWSARKIEERRDG